MENSVQFHIGARLSRPITEAEEVTITTVEQENVGIDGSAGYVPSETTQPDVTTFTATNNVPGSVQLNGEVTDDGGLTIIERGFYLSDSETTLNGLVSNGTKVIVGGTVGVYSSVLTTLTPVDQYFFVAFATNAGGSGYGNLASFATAHPATAAAPTQGGGLLEFAADTSYTTNTLIPSISPVDANGDFTSVEGRTPGYGGAQTGSVAGVWIDSVQGWNADNMTWTVSPSNTDIENALTPESPDNNGAINFTAPSSGVYGITFADTANFQQGFFEYVSPNPGVPVFTTNLNLTTTGWDIPQESSLSYLPTDTSFALGPNTSNTSSDVVIPLGTGDEDISDYEITYPAGLDAQISTLGDVPGTFGYDSLIMRGVPSVINSGASSTTQDIEIEYLPAAPPTFTLMRDQGWLDSSFADADNYSLFFHTTYLIFTGRHIPTQFTSNTPYITLTPTTASAPVGESFFIHSQVGDPANDGDTKGTIGVGFAIADGDALMNASEFQGGNSESPIYKIGCEISNTATFGTITRLTDPDFASLMGADNDGTAEGRMTNNGRVFCNGLDGYLSQNIDPIVQSSTSSLVFTWADLEKCYSGWSNKNSSGNYKPYTIWI